MKNSFRLLVWFVVVFAFGFGFLATCAPAAQAQGLGDPMLPVSADTQNAILRLLSALAATHPLVATAITILGSMRIWAKPLFGAIHAIVELTPGKEDDGLWTKAYLYLTETSSGRTLAWLLDYVASIKLIPPGEPPAVPVANVPEFEHRLPG